MNALNLYHVQDPDRPLYVLAPDWIDALRAWQNQIRRENDMGPGEEFQPTGIQLVARHDEIVLGAPLPVAASDVEDDDSDDDEEPELLCEGCQHAPATCWSDDDVHLCAKCLEACDPVTEDGNDGVPPSQPQAEDQLGGAKPPQPTIVALPDLRPATAADLVRGAKVWYTPILGEKAFRGVVAWGSFKLTCGQVMADLCDMEPAYGQFVGLPAERRVWAACLEALFVRATPGVAP